MNQHEILRNQMIDILGRDLFGPYDGDEEELNLGSDETPYQRYLTGIIFPRDTQFSPENDDGGIGNESFTEEDDTEAGLAMSNTKAPSCFGMSFSCPEEVKRIEVKVKAGIYTHTESATAASENEKKGNFWKRTPLEWSHIFSIAQPGEIKETIKDKLILCGRIRPADNAGTKAITIALVNENQVELTNTKERCQKSFFQVHMSASGIKNELPFTERRPINPISADKELQSLHLLYSASHNFAVGHGCSVEWNDEKYGKTGFIETSFIPKHLVYPLVPPENLGLPDFSIKKIATANAKQLKELLLPIYQKYDLWISKKESELINIQAELQGVAREHLKYCKESSMRIKRGIDLLTSDPEVHVAFQLAHHAMLYHFAHSELRKKGWAKDVAPSYNQGYAWYPFQIAFILQCLESIAIPDSEERSIVDLLWFPTGGGKTEAYLGLTALVIFLRRLRSINKGQDGGGTAVITRYTLRLLTVDQFYRAALLACSCEKVRNERGKELEKSSPVSIGLWVGSEASPNRLEDARRVLLKMQRGEETIIAGDPVKLKECPWCGTALGVADYQIKDIETGMKVKCPNTGCYFHKGLPVWLVDEDLYRERPSIIIGTVDKFARVPWLKEAGYLFGADGKDAPPELIIQDELHLISGPLGTLVGLYESAIDLLCARGNAKGPKIIASTATIRNAQNQIKNLFARDVRQFPHPGIDYRDSFFACEDRTKSARLYAGVFAPGLSPTTSLIRTFGCLLHATETASISDSIKDPYRTLMGYFNSLRELGGARRQVEDDVRDYLGFCAKRDASVNQTLKCRNIDNVQELTSRVNSSELDDIRKLLWATYPSGECLDVVLATNMISVGLDVPRLGLMVVVGQPKTTSEYIQATSRVGRKYPGLVVVVYNWTRSRDRSHYEKFKTYHSRLYSEVEATSVTPFSSRSRDRGLHAVLVSLVRHLIPGMSENEAAGSLNISDTKLLELLNALRGRIESVDSLELNDSAREIEEILKRWEQLKIDGELSYASSKTRSLLKPAEKNDTTSFPTLNSLRNIDQTVGLYLKRL